MLAEGKVLIENVRDKGGWDSGYTDIVILLLFSVMKVSHSLTDTTWEMIENEKPYWISRVSRCQGWTILAKLT